MSEHTTELIEHDEPHHGNIGERLNWLRAAVLGANDGIVSTAGIVIGVAAATTQRSTILTAGLAGLAAGAMSMAVGEYVSVSTQRDTEEALLTKERRELREEPEAELQELAEMYADKGLSAELAHQVAVQLTAHDALAAHAETELGIDPEALTRPWQAAYASFVSFTVGALVPLVAMLLVGVSARVPVTVVAVVAALLGTGWLSARLGSSPVGPAIRRNVVGGVLAMAVTYAIGSLVGTQL
ncbi:MULTISPECIES: VIT1/CCC1 transporter family protein [unclassified Knoellia]|uniref:VIT1/CCC1 transporter family protein n=1 Tax=Knoellia altitudinis TaxID=3404795 RepID=UPI00360D22B6